MGWYTDLPAGCNSGYTKYISASARQMQKVTTRGWGTALVPGIYFTPSQKILLNADFGGIGYNRNKVTNADGSYSRSSSFGFNFLNYFSFGVDFIISK